MVNSSKAQIPETQFFAINNIQDAFDLINRGFEVYSQATTGPKEVDHTSKAKSHDGAATAPVIVQKRKTHQPDLDVLESAESVTVEVSLPGVEKSGINIEYDTKQNHLILSGDYKTTARPDEVKVIRHERPNGRFERVVVLGQQVILPDQITAQYTDGVLTVTVPKNKEAETKKKIFIQ
ncbi:Heat shock protein [Taphrina deformans PYCC 5710]|uniref:Heat shock protein n=1 Tax=Taphrina deformans (strain PYCC 5710 / ATCC 11124 / CBS 356.35 / IMI 108563 / JCM 9778 / NBRC 8474) TaxID=1097556 RepID=R4X760_TAPDE|nr:Heat shock protein [Taphrina deformans PYCC 5710]|eukprot:CCG80893.1 Heat shock protein [Taphrina deformans PYCC 5710]